MFFRTIVIFTTLDASQMRSLPFEFSQNLKVFSPLAKGDLCLQADRDSRPICSVFVNKKACEVDSIEKNYDSQQTIQLDGGQRTATRF